ncbi:alkaline phosphatase family protein [Mesorhizobium sp. VK23B]|uniref:Alkaline phosphatase family protein n=1 Tax=Mesorhizobium dulcispinae TaxID=3072316 RepID=A0ABU4XGX8_9HYPH|nr:MULTISPECIES: alkaline phosphatase family protein [unclassified Mesorhizobium]MDX8467249.1 alkaline phosphatase family protein [Mesorhizobium sp. VK23B]MDX8473763.1 alkaline phosphatase family protein [Mesorhizobium sp. VK23A]
MDNRVSRPNVLLITCDQWRGDCLSAAGHPVVRTPNADALAAEGVLFRRHYGGAAPCSPARACLYTGLYQMNNRVCRNGSPLDARHGNIALSARAAGYDPTLFGYTDVAPDPRQLSAEDPRLRSYEGVLPGFSVRQALPEHQKQWLSWLRMQGIDASAGSPGIHRPAGEQGKTGGDVSNAPPIYSKDQTPTAFLAGEFIRWLGEQERGAPWFAHISFISPHPPFIVPEPYNTMYDPADGAAFRRAATWQAEAETHPYLAYDLGRQKRTKFVPGIDGKVPDWSEENFRRIRSIYYGMISELDAQLGRIWQAVKTAGAWDDTVIVLTSDHAEMMGDHFMLGKGGFFDASYHIPLIIRDPGRRAAAGASIDRFTEAVDIFPTLLDLIGAAPEAHLDGRSLAPWLDGKEPADWQDAAHWEFDFRSVADGEAEHHFGIGSRDCNLAVLRTDDFKYVHFGGGLPPLLFDLTKDPGELSNVANDPTYLPVRLEFAEKMLAWRARHLDQSLALAELTEGGVAGHVGWAVGSRE